MTSQQKLGHVMNIMNEIFELELKVQGLAISVQQLDRSNPVELSFQLRRIENEIDRATDRYKVLLTMLDYEIEELTKMYPELEALMKTLRKPA